MCLLHAYANDANERAVGAELRRLWPEVSIALSSDICREWREYERTSTTVLSAFVQPVTSRYLDSLAAGLREQGLAVTPFILQSNGGATTVAAAARNPVAMVESGPASGVLGAIELGNALGESNLATIDVGGTTAKCALVPELEPRVTTDYFIERTATEPGYPIRTPVVEIVEIGSGGGSIAAIDAGGKAPRGAGERGRGPGAGRLRARRRPADDDRRARPDRPDRRVQPARRAHRGRRRARAAGLRPPRGHPRRHGRGARGRRAPHRQCGHGDRAQARFDRQGLRPARLHPRRVRRRRRAARGRPGRSASLSRKVIVPRNPAVFSAWGMLVTDLRRDFVQTRITPARRHHGTAPWSGVRRSRAPARSRRWAGQSRHRTHLLPLRGPALPGSGAHGQDPVSRRTSAPRLPGSTKRTNAPTRIRLDQAVELVNLHVTVRGALGGAHHPRLASNGSSVPGARTGTRGVDFDEDGHHDAAIYQRTQLPSGSGRSPVPPSSKRTPRPVSSRPAVWPGSTSTGTCTSR